MSEFGKKKYSAAFPRRPIKARKKSQNIFFLTLRWACMGKARTAKARKKNHLHIRHGLLDCVRFGWMRAYGFVWRVCATVRTATIADFERARVCKQRHFRCFPNVTVDNFFFWHLHRFWRNNNWQMCWAHVLNSSTLFAIDTNGSHEDY